MTFLHIAFLGGIAAVAVPVVLHLIMRQQPKHLEFPALRFVLQRKDANRRRMRLRHLLLLLLRCAAIALLALALARPSMQAAGMLGNEEAPVAAALVFDTSPRMDYRLNNKTRLDEAKETGLWLLSQLPPESEATVMDSRTSSAAFAAELASARQRVTRLTAAPAEFPLLTVLDDAIRLLSESDKQRKEIYLFTDLSQGGLPTSVPPAWHARMESLGNIGLYVIDVGALEPRNFALGEPRLPSEVLARNSPLTLQLDIARTGFGTEAAEDERTIELYLQSPGEAPVARGREVARFGPGDSQSLTFRVAGLEAGVHQGFVKIFGQDNLECDDTRYFTVVTRPAWKVLIAAPPKPDDYALFLHEALAPYAQRIKGEASYRCDVVNLKELATRKLEDYSAVFVLDPTPLSDAEWQQLSAYAFRGGGVAIFLGRNAHPMAAFNSPAAQEVLPGKLVRQWRSGERDITLAPGSLQHPLLARFQPLASSVPWDAFPVFRHWDLGQLADGSAIVMDYSNGMPALIERPLGRGSVLTMTTPISDPSNRADMWNNLPYGEGNWPIFMLVNEMARYLVGSGNVRLNYLAGETVAISLGKERVPTMSLVTPRGDIVPQAVGETQNSLVVAATDTVGNYQASGTSEAGRVDLGFSVNLPETDSRLERLTAEQVKALFEPAPYRVARTREQIKRDVNVSRVGVELYPHLMLLLALVLVAEQVLSNRFYRAREEQKPGGASLAAEFKAATAATPPPLPVGNPPTASEATGIPS